MSRSGAISSIPSERTRNWASPAQRRAADPGASVWVDASAGAGKTKVLTDRVLRLLLANTPPERILCLTFTKAAAAEMATRIGGTLGDWATMDDARLAQDLDGLGADSDADTIARARALFVRVIDAPGGLKLMTLHAFCQSLLRRFPLEASVAPHFTVLDERSAQELLMRAMHALMARAHRDGDPVLTQALNAVTERVAETTFTALVGEIVHERARFSAAVGPDPDAAAARTFARLGVDPADTDAAIVAAACADGTLEGEALRSAARALLAGTRSECSRGEAITRWLAAGPAERAATFEDYLAIFFGAEGRPRAKLANQKTIERHPGIDADLAHERMRLEAIQARRRALYVAQGTVALQRLGMALIEAYDRLKQARAAIDYDDQILLARALLTRPGIAPWVLYKLDGGIDHVLIDEAQDTSPAQWNVVSALADEFFAGEGAVATRRTLFAVGDIKQSIFSFQGARPDALRGVRDRFARGVSAVGETWRDVHLALSYRATPVVLRAVDAVFANEAMRAQLGAETVNHGAERTGKAGLVEVWPSVTVAKPEGSGPWPLPLRRQSHGRPESRLAQEIVRRIRHWLDSGERLEARGRAIRPGDIMILVRRRTALVDELVRALKLARVPVLGVDRMVLSEQIAVMDLIALGRFLLLPRDDLSLAEVLRSPLVGLGEEALFALAHDRGGASLWRRLGAHRGATDAFGRAHAMLSELLAQVDFVTPFELYARLLGAGGGRQRMRARLGLEADEPMSEFLNLALLYEQSHPPSLQGFLQWLAAGRTEVKRDLQQGGDEVRILTVHGAKGLEAPIVFLPDTVQRPPRTTGLLWDADGGLLWPGRKANDEARCAAARERFDAAEAAEQSRLLYVAMTRAEDRLYVCGWHGQTPPEATSWYGLVRAGLEDLAEPFDFVPLDDGAGWQHVPALRLAEGQSVPVEMMTPPAHTHGERAIVPSDLRTPVSAPPRARLAPSATDAGEAVPSPRGERAALRRRGRIVHTLLQTLPERAPSERADAARRYLEARHGDLDPTARAAIVAETLAVLDAPAAAALFGPSSRAEVAIAGRIGDRLVQGRIDRLVVTPEEVLIADYKSGHAPFAQPGRIPIAHIRQMAAYRAVIARIYPDRSVRCALVWTEGPVLTWLSDADLAAGAP